MFWKSSKPPFTLCLLSSSSSNRCAVDLISTVFLFDGRRLQGKKTPDEVELGPNHVSGLSPIHVTNSNMVSEPRCVMDLISTVFLLDGRRLQGKKTPDEVELGPNHVSALSPIHVVNSNMVSEPRCVMDLISTVFLLDGRHLQGKKTPDEVELGPNHVSGLSPIHVVNSNMVSEPRCVMDLISTVFLFDGRRLHGKKTPDEVELGPNHVSGFSPIHVMNSNMVSEPRCVMDLISTVFLFDGRRLQGKKTPDEEIEDGNEIDAYCIRLNGQMLIKLGQITRRTVELGTNHVSGLSPIHVMNSNMVSEPRCVMDLISTVFLFDGRRLQGKKTPDEEIEDGNEIDAYCIRLNGQMLIKLGQITRRTVELGTNHVSGLSPIHVMNSNMVSEPRCVMDLISTVFLFDGRRLHGKKTPDEVELGPNHVSGFSPIHVMNSNMVSEPRCVMDLISTVFLFDGRRLQGKKTPDEEIEDGNEIDAYCIRLNGQMLIKLGQITRRTVELGTNHVSGLSPIHVMNSNMVSEPRCVMDLISTVFLFDGRRLQGKKTPDEEIEDGNEIDAYCIRLNGQMLIKLGQITRRTVELGTNHVSGLSPIHVMNSNMVSEPRCVMDLISTVFLFDGRRLQGKKTPDEEIEDGNEIDAYCIRLNGQMLIKLGQITRRTVELGTNHVSGLSPIHVMNSNMVSEPRCVMDLISTVFLFDGRRLQGKKTPDEEIEDGNEIDAYCIRLNGQMLIKLGQITRRTVELGPNHVSGLSPIHVMNSNMLSEPRCVMDLISTVFLFDGRRLQGKKTPDEEIEDGNEIDAYCIRLNGQMLIKLGQITRRTVELGPNHVSGLSPIHVMNSNMVSEPRCVMDLISTVFLFDGRRLQGKKTPDEEIEDGNEIDAYCIRLNGQMLIKLGQITRRTVELGPNHVSGLSPIHVMNSNMLSEPRCVMDLISTVFLFDGRRLQGKKTPDEEIEDGNEIDAYCIRLNGQMLIKLGQITRRTVELGPNHVSGLSPIHVMNSNMVSEPRCVMDLISTVFLFDGRRLQGKKTPDEEIEDGNEIDAYCIRLNGQMLIKLGQITRRTVELGPNHVSGLSPIHVMNSNMVSEPRCVMDLISTVFLFDGRRLQGKKTPDEEIEDGNEIDAYCIRLNGQMLIKLGQITRRTDGTEIIFKIRRDVKQKKTYDRCAMDLISTVFLFDGRCLQGKKTPDEVIYSFSSQYIRVIIIFDYGCAMDLISNVFLFDGRRLQGKQTPDELEMEDGNEIDALLHQIGGTNAWQAGTYHKKDWPSPPPPLTFHCHCNRTKPYSPYAFAVGNSLHPCFYFFVSRSLGDTGKKNEILGFGMGGGGHGCHGEGVGVLVRVLGEWVEDGPWKTENGPGLGMGI
ncbi:hypothetical protein RD792_007938 [Penstemon davidsonii]|uniref:Ubiquitin-like domain-containing protein n=1 Tax=Penstemon davidsonii TaxID=160366 RepID=A0ABR0D9H9_9LAMI|nr:hypothetical protein RD792_007938 [Penstemon davidsonii]